MGCDIHIYVEAKREGKWVSVDKWIPFPYPDESTEGRMWVNYEDRIYCDRNYEVFAALADVRNDGNIRPISAPKMLPSDISHEVKNEADHWVMDGHSYSHFTLAELEAVNWSGYDRFIWIKKQICDGIMITLREKSNGDPESIRIVFWFDN